MKKKKLNQISYFLGFGFPFVIFFAISFCLLTLKSLIEYNNFLYINLPEDLFRKMMRFFFILL